MINGDKNKKTVVRNAELLDLPEILEIFRAARKYMRESGNPRQWGDTYPSPALLQEDLIKKQLFVVEINGRLCGAFVFFIGEEPTYRIIEDGAWIDDGPYGTIHRVASDGTEGGIFERCLAFCLERSGNLRIDTHSDNRIMQRLIEKSGFVRCGIIHLADESTRIAYQYSSDGTACRR